MPRLQILQHKSYHPYLEKNKQRVREDEARARAEEEERERRRIDAENEIRLNALRQRAGSPSLPSLSSLAPGLPTPGRAEEEEEEEEDDNLPSTSAVPLGGSKSLIERHREKKAREEKRERKIKERLDFDFPSETARKDARRKARELEKEQEATKASARASGHGTASGSGGGAAGKGSGEERHAVDTYDVDEEGRPAVLRAGVGEWESGGHVNLFADLEQAETKSLGTTKPKVTAKDDPFTMFLGRPEKETKPWYTDRELRRHEEREAGEEAEERRARDRRKDARSKARNDPLTHLNSLLSSSKHPAPTRRPVHHPAAGAGAGAAAADPSAARIKREQTERERAIALIAKAKAPIRPWDATPSTVAGGDGSWSEAFEREKDKAGRRFFGTTELSGPYGGHINAIPNANANANGHRGGWDGRDGHRGSWDRETGRGGFRDAGFRRPPGRSWEV